MKDDLTAAQRQANAAFCEALLAVLLPGLRAVARADGYALAVHGSLSRDIDLVAIPWHGGALPAERLVENLVSAIGEQMGAACLRGEPWRKPHGRVAYTVVMSGCIPFIDLSVMPRVAAEGGQ